MPPIRKNKFPKGITLTRNNDIIKNTNNGNKLIKLIAEGAIDNIVNKVIPTSVSSIPTTTILPGPISLTTSATPTDVSINTDTIDSAAGTDISPIGTATDISPTGTATDISPTGTATDISPTGTAADNSANGSPANANVPGSLIPTETSTPKTSGVPLSPTISTSIISTTIQTHDPSPSTFPTTTTTPSSKQTPSSNNIHAWVFPLLAILLLIIIITFLGGLVYKRRKRKITKNLQNINARDISEKDNESGSKSNSLTSSINSISSSFKKKKGKIVPGDIPVGSSAPTVIDNRGENEKPKMPILKRTPTTVSAFREMVHLTDEEHYNLLRQSNSSGIYTIASRLSSTPSYVNYYPEEGPFGNAVTVIPDHFDTASGNGNGSTFATDNNEGDN